MKSSCSLIALVAAGALLAPEVAAAQAQNQAQPQPSRSGTVEEVVVTAGKREQSLQDVPVSVAVVTGETIKDLAITNLDELSLYVPGFVVQEGGEQTGISIRGFGASLNFGIDQSVGLFIDEIYAGRERQFRGTFLDVERIEVLKGPQGTLFGKNTIAGAVTMTTGTPTHDPSLSVRGEYGPVTNRRAIEAVANGPIIRDVLAGRLAVRMSSDDGYMYNTLTNEDEEQEDDKVLRATLLWTPTDALRVRAKYEWSEYDRIGRHFQVSEISGFAVGRPLSTSPTTLLPLPTRLDVGAASNLNIYRFYDPRFDFGLDYTTSKQRETSHVVSRGGALDISYDLGFATLRAITGYSGYESEDGRDVDWNPTPFLYEPISQEFESWSQEIRLVSDVGEKFDYIAGLYWFRSDFFVDRRTDIDINLFINPAVSSPNFRWSNLRFLKQTAETRAVYAQGTWHFTPNLHLTGGLRWMTETKTAEDKFDRAEFGTDRFLDPKNPADAALIAIGQALAPAIAAQAHHNFGERTEEHVTPEARLSWDANEDMMFYASYAKGYKGGGFNSQSISPAGEDQTFRPEKSTAYELGGKLRLLDRTMNINFAIFRQNFEDLQLSIWQGSGFILTNAGAARSQGIEGDVVWQVDDRVRVSFAATAIDAVYTESVFVACNIGQLNFGQPGCFLIPAPTPTNPAAQRPVQDFNGKRFAPKLSWTAGASYLQPIGSSLELALRTDVKYRAKGEFALDPTIVQPSYIEVDLGARLYPADPDGRWSLGLTVTNVLDKRRYFYEFEAPAQTGTRIGFPAPPRRAVINFTYDFF
jgi:iron complex outermembrane recepter protein